MSHSIPVAMTIAGSDCSAGAGIQADLKTFQHFRVHGLTALTCVVSETPLVVQAVHPVPVAIVRDQISLMLDSFPIAAIKTGMLVSAEHVVMVADLLRAHPSIALVVDPVMIASSGASLLETAAIAAYRDLLLPMARVITPNLPEAETLLGEPITDMNALEAAARMLALQFGTAVLLKGGHLLDPHCVDVLVDRGELSRYSAPRLAVDASHGTGCTLAAAITAALACGQSLPEAISTAKTYLGQTLRQSYAFTTPGGASLHVLNQGTVMRQSEMPTGG